MLRLRARADHRIEPDRSRFRRPEAGRPRPPFRCQAGEAPPLTSSSPALPQREPIDNQRDCSQAEPGRSIKPMAGRSHRAGRLCIRHLARLQSRRRRCGDQAHAGPAVGNDDPAHQSACPVEFGVRILSPADLDAHAGSLRAGRAVDDLHIAGVALHILAAHRALADRLHAHPCRMTKQRKLAALERNRRPGDRRKLLRLRVSGEQRLLPLGPLQLPDAETDQHRNGPGDDKAREHGHAARHSLIRPSRARCVYSWASSARLGEPQPADGQRGGDRDPDEVHPPRRLGRGSSTSAPTTTIAPTMKIRNAAGPSPTLKVS